MKNKSKRMDLEIRDIKKDNINNYVKERFCRKFYYEHLFFELKKEEITPHIKERVQRKVFDIITEQNYKWLQAFEF